MINDEFLDNDMDMPKRIGVKGSDCFYEIDSWEDRGFNMVGHSHNNGKYIAIILSDAIIPIG